MTGSIAEIYDSGYVRPERYETEPVKPSIYQYFIANTRTGDVVTEIPLTGVSWSLAVSKAAELSGAVPIDQVPGLDLYEATLPIKSSLFVMKDGLVVWGGIIWNRSYTTPGASISITCSTFESYLFSRHIWHTTSYSNAVDEYAVARGLIDLMQTDFNATGTVDDGVIKAVGSASIGLLYETRTSGRHQDTQTWDGGGLTSFGDALTEFSNNLNGFEWNIKCGLDPAANKFTKTLVFRDTTPALTPLGGTYTGVRTGLDVNLFEYPGNISSVTLDESGDHSSTRYIVTGGDTGVDGYVPKAAWNNNDYLNSGWPLVEIVNSSHSSVSSPATLLEYANIGGRKTRPLVPTWSVLVNGAKDPAIGTYAVGDWCHFVVNDTFISRRLNLPNGVDTSDMIKRIMGFTVSVPDVPQEPEQVTLELEDEWVEST